jgi:anaerobic ribonucleoside-triphosphate reductase activating protein
VSSTMWDNLRISGTVNDSIVDGPGLRYVIFTQGCPHHCPGCHNPETLDFSGGKLISTQTLYENICSNPLLSGVTFSGGEPFVQAAQLFTLAKEIKKAGLELAIYSGYTLEELLQDEAKHRLLSYADVLIDGRFVLAERSLTLPFRGSVNQRIIDVPASLQAGNAVLVNDGRWQTINA